MTVQSSLLGPVKISGVEAQAFTRLLKHGKTNNAAMNSAKKGKSIVVNFTKNQSVTFKVLPSKTHKIGHLVRC